MDRFRPRWLGFVSGVLLLVGGVVAIVWPGATLLVIATVVGVGMVLGGAMRTFAALADRSYGGWWLVLAGGLLTRSRASSRCRGRTILVLAVLLVRTLLPGVIEIGFALSLRRLHGELQARSRVG